jgi:taurine dioxygenase
MRYEVRAIDHTFAREVVGLRLWQTPDARTAAALQRLYGEYGLLLFRRQAISEDEFAEFCALFGRLERTVRTDWASRVRPEIGLITNLRDAHGNALGGLGDGELEWHSDQAYMRDPATGSGLHAVEIAHVGGMTSWANLALAYAALPQHLKHAVEGKRAIFSYPKRLTLYQGADREITAEARRRTPDVVHALVHVNPVSGEQALYLDPTTTIGIVDMPQDEADALLDELAAFATRPEFVYDHHWQVGDVLLWSNGFTLHKREPFPATERRLMKRATMVLPRAAHIVPDGELAMAA